ncbi:hypothetical protein [Jiulongibacter sediminis]|uniref:Uncharacterized protein n=1 Tax=Jiulongibacter sediminis TaxID=1605367 RepID=A0A0P7C5D4_9BACT|nr:hypothetical protein [Jiulongibacter sediminis]KPM48491.1 hypothetical protein AFM12_07640 [Jiulongibacter sediminis]TBX25029.1 hypothetical protein TK44_07645 [Jiulongibacter sediminis]
MRLIIGVIILLFLIFYSLMNNRLVKTELKFEDVLLQKAYPVQNDQLREHGLVEIEVSPTISFQEKSWLTRSYGLPIRHDYIVLFEGQSLGYSIENLFSVATGEIVEWSLTSDNIFLGSMENVDLRTNSYPINKTNIKLVIVQTSDTLSVGESVLIQTPLLSL